MLNDLFIYNLDLKTENSWQRTVSRGKGLIIKCNLRNFIRGYYNACKLNWKQFAALSQLVTHNYNIPRCNYKMYLESIDIILPFFGFL